MSTKKKAIPTKERILEVAERLFAEKGLDGTSMRDITEAAGVNLAAVNYHFGSKDGLISSVFKRHLEPLNEQRLNMLDAVEKAAGSGPPNLEAVLEALIRPAVARALDSEKCNDSFMRLMGRCMSEPPAHAEKHILPHFKTLRERFDAALGRAAPHLPPEEVFWRLTFVAGSLHYALHVWGRRESFPILRDATLDVDRLVQRLVSFAAEGLRAESGEGASLRVTSEP